MYNFTFEICLNYYLMMKSQNFIEKSDFLKSYKNGKYRFDNQCFFIEIHQFAIKIFANIIIYIKIESV